MTPEGQTERLLLRPISLADVEQIQALFPRWEVVQLLDSRVPWPFSPDGVRAFFEHVALPMIERGEAWTWTLRLKSAPDRIIGSIDLRAGEQDNRGFWLAPEWQGRGLMSEACVWTNDFWFETLGFEKMRVAKAEANVASMRISETQGMRMVGRAEKDFVGGRLPSETWEITAEQWQEWKAKATR